MSRFDPMHVDLGYIRGEEPKGKTLVDALREGHAEGMRRVQMADEITRLRSLAASCYAGLGAECNLPEPWLDALHAAAEGRPFSTEGLLPFKAEPKVFAASQANADLLKAVHRLQLMQTTPVTFEMAVNHCWVSGMPDLLDDSTRAAFFAVWALAARELADAMIEEAAK